MRSKISSAVTSNECPILFEVDQHPIPLGAALVCESSQHLGHPLRRVRIRHPGVSTWLIRALDLVLLYRFRVLPA